MFVTPSETVNNPISVSLENGTVWAVTGQGWLSELSIDQSSRLRGRLFLDGKETDPVPGVYRGSVCVIPD